MLDFLSDLSRFEWLVLILLALHAYWADRSRKVIAALEDRVDWIADGLGPDSWDDH